jgi:hypothetical protein
MAEVIDEFQPPMGKMKVDEKDKEFPRINEWEVKLPEIKEENFKLENGELDTFGFARATSAAYLFGYCKILQLTLNEKIMLGQDKENPLTEDEIIEFYKRQESTMIKLCETYSMLEIMNTNPDFVRPATDKEGKIIPGSVTLNPEQLDKLGGIKKDSDGKRTLNWAHLKEKYDREVALAKGIAKDGEVADGNLKKNLEYLNEKKLDTEGDKEARSSNFKGEEGENDREKLYRESTEATD